jgi:hypothetical protein
LPTSVQQDEVAKKALTYGVIDLLLFGAGKLLHPIETVSGMRDAAATKATQQGATVDGNTIVDAVKKWAIGDPDTGESGVPASIRDQAGKFYMDIMNKYMGRTLTIDQALEDKAASWGVSNAASNGAFEVGNTAVKQGEATVADLIRQQLPQSIQNYDKILQMLYTGQRVGGTTLPWIAKATGALGLYEGGRSIWGSITGK